MKQQVAAGIIAVALLGGTGTGVAIRSVQADTGKPQSKPSASATTDKPTRKPTAATTKAAPQQPQPKPATTTPAPPALLPLSSLQINTGAVGPVSVGMTKDAAAATGYFDTDVEVPSCGRVDPLQWKTDYAAVLDVSTGADGSVTSIGVRAAGPRTRSGLGVGSTYATVRGVVGEAVVPEAAGYDQVGMFVTDGAGWIGFLFDATVDTLTDETPVTFVEVTRGAKPGLMRDGC